MPGIGSSRRALATANSTGGTWLQLSLASSAAIHAYRLSAVCASAACASSGLDTHEVWVSDNYEQSYSNLTQRCFSGEAPQLFAAFYQPCGLTGRFVRLRLVSGDPHRALRLAEVELFSTAEQPPPSPPAADVLSAMYQVTPIQAVLRLTGNGADACIDRDGSSSAEACGYDAVACGDAPAHTDASRAACCAAYPTDFSNLPDFCDAPSPPALPSSPPPVCQQPIADDPYLDVQLPALDDQMRLAAIALKAPPNEPYLAYFQVSVSLHDPHNDSSALEACAEPDGVAVDTGATIVRRCDNLEDARWVRVRLPGKNRILRLLEVTQRHVRAADEPTSHSAEPTSHPAESTRLSDG